MNLLLHNVAKTLSAISTKLDEVFIGLGTM